MPGARQLSLATLIHSAWNSMALRAAAALGLGGVVLAASNLILARVLPPGEFAEFALLYAIVQVGINVGPIGADVTLTRRLITPGAKLCRQAFRISHLLQDPFDASRALAVCLQAIENVATDIVDELIALLRRHISARPAECFQVFVYLAGGFITWHC